MGSGIRTTNEPEAEREIGPAVYSFEIVDSEDSKHVLDFIAQSNDQQLLKQTSQRQILTSEQHNKLFLDRSVRKYIIKDASGKIIGYVPLVKLSSIQQFNQQNEDNFACTQWLDINFVQNDLPEEINKKKRDDRIFRCFPNKLPKEPADEIDEIIKSLKSGMTYYAFGRFGWVEDNGIRERAMRTIKNDLKEQENSAHIPIIYEGEYKESEEPIGQTIYKQMYMSISMDGDITWALKGKIPYLNEGLHGNTEVKGFIRGGDFNMEVIKEKDRKTLLMNELWELYQEAFNRERKTIQVQQQSRGEFEAAIMGENNGVLVFKKNGEQKISGLWVYLEDLEDTTGIHSVNPQSPLFNKKEKKTLYTFTVADIPGSYIINEVTLPVIVALLKLGYNIGGDMSVSDGAARLFSISIGGLSRIIKSIKSEKRFHSWQLI